MKTELYSTGYSTGHGAGVGAEHPEAHMRQPEHPNKCVTLKAQCAVRPEAGSDRTRGNGCAAEHALETPAPAGMDDQGRKGEHQHLDADILEQLATLDPVSYDRMRKEKSHELGIRASTLDELVGAKRKEKAPESASMFTVGTAEPWPDPVDGERLLDDLLGTLLQFVVLADPAYVAVPLWILQTYGFQHREFSPILHVKSPEKRCGKSLLLDLLERLVHRPILTANISSAALFRAIERLKPTLLMDEFDSIARAGTEKAESLRNILNSGFQRGRPAIRCAGDKSSESYFNVFCPKIVASIGELPDTAADRAIVIPMKRKLKAEKVKRLRGFQGLFFGGRKSLRWSAERFC